MTAPTNSPGRFRLCAHRMAEVMSMDPCALAAAVTALANALACRFDNDSLTIISALLVQLGDTLATIVTQRSICKTANNATGQVGT